MYNSQRAECCSRCGPGGGIEPPTFSLRPRRSANVSFGPSGWRDLNSRPPRPERGALPSCATTGSERVTGIEPAPPAWEAGVLPLNYTRVTLDFSFLRRLRTALKILFSWVDLPRGSSSAKPSRLFTRSTISNNQLISISNLDSVND